MTTKYNKHSSSTLPCFRKLLAALLCHWIWSTCLGAAPEFVANALDKSCLILLRSNSNAQDFDGFAYKPRAVFTHQKQLVQSILAWAAISPLSGSFQPVNSGRETP